MGKVVLLLLLALVVWLAVRVLLRRAGPKDRGAAAHAEDMVECAHCALNLPRGEAIRSGGRFYCSQEHRAAVTDDSSRG